MNELNENENEPFGWVMGELGVLITLSCLNTSGSINKKKKKQND